MRLDHLRRLNGPNIYLSRPVAIARLELEELTGHETTDHAGFAERLTALLPGLAGHHCAAGRPGGLLDAMARGTYFGHVTEHLTLELSGLAGREVFFGRTVRAGAPGCYDVILECPRDEAPETSVAEELVGLAVHAVTEVLAGRTPCLDADLARIAAAYESTKLGVSTAALARAARRRDIPVRRVGPLNLLELGHGRHRRRLWAAMTSGTSAIGMEIAGDKTLTKRLLAEAGVPVADGRTVLTAEEAIAAFREIGAPVVVKPLHGHQGEGVSLELTSPTEVVVAFREAAASGGQVLVESYVRGADYRVLVIGGRLAAAAELTAARIIGDGTATVTALVERANSDPARGEGHDRPLTRLALGPAELAQLAKHGHGTASVPGPGETVWLRRNANLSTGGTSRDVTDLVHPRVAELCVRAAAAVGLDVCGLDLRLPDIAAPPPAEPGGAAVVEVNASPGLRMHLAPYEGEPRDVAAGIIDLLYPPGRPARVPIVSVTGTNGKTTTVRMIAHVLGGQGRRVGLTSTEGVHVGERLIYQADASGPRSAEMVLGDPAVDVAVLETARGGIVRRGLGYDRADVAVITNITPDHLGTDDIDTVEDLADIKALVAEEIRPGGHLVLGAQDPLTAAIAGRPKVQDRTPVIRLFAVRPDVPAIAEHLREGGIAYFVEEGHLVEGEGDGRTPLLPVADLAGAFDGRAEHVVANALAAAAACRALGTGIGELAAALRGFEPHTLNQGRGCVYRVADQPETPIVVDYAHNPAAVDAMTAFLRNRWERPGIAVVTLPGDRCDDLVVETGRAIAVGFDRVVVYEDEDLRGREPGEMTRLIAQGLRGERPDVRIRTAGDLKEALGAGLSLASPGEPLLLLYEKLAPVSDLLNSHAAMPW